MGGLSAFRLVAAGIVVAVVLYLLLDAALVDGFEWARRADNGNGGGALSLRRRKTDCQRILTNATLDFTTRNAPRVLLSSYPRSGNSWTRQILEKVSGVMTGSIYPEGWCCIKGSGLLGGGVVSNVIVVKTHQMNTTIWPPWWEANRQSGRATPHIARPSDRAILLVRNPFDSLYSNLQFFDGSHGSNHILTALDPLNNEDHAKIWENTIRTRGEGWRTYHSWWLARSSPTYPVLLVRYEDLKNDMEKEIRRMMDFLGRPVDEDRLRCTLPATSCSSLSRNCREGLSGVQLKYYNKVQREIMLSIVGPLMTRMGYELPPVRDPTPEELAAGGDDDDDDEDKEGR